MTDLTATEFAVAKESPRDIEDQLTAIFDEEVDRLLECEEALRCISSTPATWISATA